jgi:hypothetical protein
MGNIYGLAVIPESQYKKLDDGSIVAWIEDVGAMVSVHGGRNADAVFNRLINGEDPEVIKEEICYNCYNLTGPECKCMEN